MKTEKRKFGDIGESLAVKFLEKRGFELLERNFLRKWGEIDIVARKEGVVRFIEVKTMRTNFDANRETGDSWRAEENIHPSKLARISRTIQSYVLEKNYGGGWQLDAIVATIGTDLKRVKIKFIENVVI